MAFVSSLIKEIKHFNPSVRIFTFTIAPCVQAQVLLNLAPPHSVGLKIYALKTSKCMTPIDRPIAIESWETGVIENILVRNIHAKNTGNALFIKLNKPSCL